MEAQKPEACKPMHVHEAGEKTEDISPKQTATEHKEEVLTGNLGQKAAQALRLIQEKQALVGTTLGTVGGALTGEKGKRVRSTARGFAKGLGTDVGMASGALLGGGLGGITGGLATLPLAGIGAIPGAALGALGGGAAGGRMGYGITNSLLGPYKSDDEKFQEQMARFLAAQQKAQSSDTAASKPEDKPKEKTENKQEKEKAAFALKTSARGDALRASVPKEEDTKTRKQAEQTMSDFGLGLHEGRAIERSGMQGAMGAIGTVGAGTGLAYELLRKKTEEEKKQQLGEKVLRYLGRAGQGALMGAGTGAGLFAFKNATAADTAAATAKELHERDKAYRSKSAGAFDFGQWLKQAASTPAYRKAHKAQNRAQYSALLKADGGRSRSFTGANPALLDAHNYKYVKDRWASEKREQQWDAADGRGRTAATIARNNSKDQQTKTSAFAFGFKVAGNLTPAGYNQAGAAGVGIGAGADIGGMLGGGLGALHGLISPGDVVAVRDGQPVVKKRNRLLGALRGGAAGFAGGVLGGAALGGAGMGLAERFSPGMLAKHFPQAQERINIIRQQHAAANK